MKKKEAMRKKDKEMHPEHPLKHHTSNIEIVIHGIEQNMGCSRRIAIRILKNVAKAVVKNCKSIR